MKFLLLIVFMAITSPLLYGQEKQDSLFLLNNPGDFLNFQDKMLEIDFYFELNGTDIIFPETNENMWLWTYHSLKNQNVFQQKDMFPEFISLPLYRRYMEDSKFNPVKAVLGMAQAGAAGYLIYKSVKKYGLFR